MGRHIEATLRERALEASLSSLDLSVDKREPGNFRNIYLILRLTVRMSM